MTEKLASPFAGRSEVYNRGLAKMKRLSELKVAQNWSDHELDIAISIVEETLPMSLHVLGAPRPTSEDSFAELTAL